jgi:hypothetical protein
MFSNFLRTQVFTARDSLLAALGSRRKRPLLRLPWLLLLLLLPTPAMAQETAPGTDAGIAFKAAEALIKYESVPYVSGNRRDPFLNQKPVQKKAAPGDEEITPGTPPPGIAGTYIAKANLEGISIGKDRKIAVVRGADSRAYFLKEGDRLFDGYLKSILDDSIIFVRETKMRSGKILTNDITKRLRTP